MGLLSFFKGLFSKTDAQESIVEPQIKVAPVVTPDPVVVDTETATEISKPERKKRAPKVTEQPATEKKTIQKKAKK